MRKVELVIIWESGEREVYEYQTVDDAKKAMRGMKMAFGEQISWMGVVEKR